MKNKVIFTNSKEIYLLKKDFLADSDVFLVEIDGDTIQSYNDFISVIQKKFYFPSSCIDNIDGYLDWITDLSWIKQKKIVIIIYKYHNLCKKNKLLKNKIINNLREDVLLFWEEEVKHVVVGGKPRSFLVYGVVDGN